MFLLCMQERGSILIAFGLATAHKQLGVAFGCFGAGAMRIDRPRDCSWCAKQRRLYPATSSFSA